MKNNIRILSAVVFAKQEIKLGNYDRISSNYGMNKPARSVYEYYFNIAVQDETGAGSERALIKVYCRATSGRAL